VSSALPGRVDARLHVDGLELRGWTRHDSIRFTDRTLAALVQSACNKAGSRQVTHNHVRSAYGAWMAGPCRIPKLTVRVRFPSPAAHTKERCNTSESVDSRRLCRSVLSVHARATLGHIGPQISTPQHSSSVQKDAPPVPSRSPTVRSPVLPTAPRVYLRKHELDVNGLNDSAAEKHDQ